LLVGGSPGLSTWIGLPLLGHLGYRTLTSLPIGQVPGKPMGVARQRKNQRLRSRVVAFLNEVRRVEDYALRATASDDVQANLSHARARMMVAAGEVAKVAGRFGLELESRAERSRALRGF
jgi:hypothetical protein